MIFFDKVTYRIRTKERAMTKKHSPPTRQPQQPHLFNKDTCSFLGWTTGVILALLVAVALVTGVAPSLSTISMMMPVVVGAFFAVIVLFL
jgi:hypothetical protein